MSASQSTPESTRNQAPSPADTTATVPAGALAPWEVAALPMPPMAGWRLWIGLIGPGVVLAGTSIGTGEWLFGPGVSAQYGASLFWLALTSIMFQAFCNLMVMRYAIYCGEPVIVGILRTRPGPMFWIGVFLILDFAAIWPYNASNAAVPLAAAIYGYLPQIESDPLVKGLGFAIFVLAFVPLVFGGTVYRMLEAIMTAKLVLVLGYLSVIAVLLVSAPVFWDVVTGFTSFGTVPLRPDTLIVGRHFPSIKAERDDGTSKVGYFAKGTWESDGTVTGELVISRDGQPENKVNLRAADKVSALPEQDRAALNEMLDRTRAFAGTDRFLVEIEDASTRLTAEGTVVDHHYWQPANLTVRTGGVERQYASLEELPETHRSRLDNHLRHEGLAYVGMIGYVSQHGRLPNLDWAMIVGFIAIAGAGGLTNTMFSNYARDKGWGMGRHVGAIPSAIGGVSIGLSHTGKVFPLDEANLSSWRGWMRHIMRDQSIWIFASIVGMALPCMMSLEFIRNATVTGDRVAAMSAEGIATRYPSFGPMLWFLTLLCGFLVLAPGQVSAGDQISRRWTDIIWSVRTNKRRNNGGGTASPSNREDVRYVYYGILSAYFIFGLVTLWTFDPLRIAKISTVLQNIALGASALLALYVNRVLLPKQIQPGWFHQIGTVCCGVFFLGISLAFLFLFFLW